MNRRFFMKALAASLSVFGLGKLVQAEDKSSIAFPHKYSRFFRRCDEATMDEFRNTIVLDDEGKAHKVPIIFATDDRAAECLQVSDKINLPLMNLYRGDLFFEDKIYAYYHLSMSSLYEEDMDQMLEQAIVKFHPKFKNKVGEYSLMSLINNYYPGGSAACVDKNAAMRGEIYSLKHGNQGEWITFKKGDPRILKYQLNMIVGLDGKP